MREQSTQEITTAARTFAEEIAKTPEYQEYQAAADAYVGNREARQLLDQLQGAQQRAQRRTAWGGPGEDENQEDLQALHDQVMAHPVLSRYFKSQEELVAVLKETNEYMAGTLGFDFAELTNPAGGCC